jgi:hypothetical protein
MHRRAFEVLVLCQKQRKRRVAFVARVEHQALRRDNNDMGASLSCGTTVDQNW